MFIITRVEKLTWKLMPPAVGDFPCSICEKEDATHRVTGRKNGVTVKVCTCEECITKAGQWERLRDEKKAMPRSRAFCLV